MADGTIINGESSVAGGSTHGPTEVAAPLEAMEYRLRRLEDAVAVLQDTQMIEDRVAERVRIQMEHKAPSHRDAANMALDAGLRLLPMLPRAAEVAMAAPQATVVAPTAAATAVPNAVPLTASYSKSWLLIETVNDLRVMLRMYTDPRYRITRIGWLVPIAVLAFVLVSHMKIFHFVFVWNLVPLFDEYLDKAFDLFAAFLGFKVLMREVARYRDVIPDAPGRKRP
jgi:hypothetical protein